MSDSHFKSSLLWFIEFKKDLVYDNTLRLKSPINLKGSIILPSTQPTSNISSHLHGCILNYLCWWFSWRAQHLSQPSDLSNVAPYSLQKITLLPNVCTYLCDIYLKSVSFVTFMSIFHLFYLFTFAIAFSDIFLLVNPTSCVLFV